MTKPSPNAELLTELGFYELSSYRDEGDISLLDPKTREPVRVLEDVQGLIAGLLCVVLNQVAYTSDEQLLYMKLAGLVDVTGVYDHGTYWITQGHKEPAGFADVQNFIRFTEF